MKNLKKLSKRGIAVLLALTMCVGMLNLTAFAADESGYTGNVFCGVEEEHTHTEKCKELVTTKELDCGLEETDGHTHGEGCYKTEKVEEQVLTCEQVEVGAHAHDADCYASTLSCEQEGSEEHQHSDGCYTSTLTCGKEETEGHTHSDDCYSTEMVDKQVLTCDQAEVEAHAHSDECYVTNETRGETLVCDKEEHTHDETCGYVRTEKQLRDELAKGGAVTLYNDIDVGSTITINNNVTLNLNGYTVKYVGETGGVFHVTGGTFTLNGTGTITGGHGTRVKWDEIVARYPDTGERAGGAVLVESGATFTMNGGTITGNEAVWGGGIAVARGGKLNIYGGSITNNTASGTTGSDRVPDKENAEGKKVIGGGGGIFCAGTGVINPVNGNISITGNATGTVNDLGGGGIFIESKGSMKIYNAIITGNHAYGQGGGVAGCLHGKVSNIAPQTAAIYDNTADGTARVTRLSAIDRNDWWYGKTSSVAKDYFCAGYSVVGKTSMNGGSANWTWWYVEKNDDNKAIKTASGDPIVVQGVTGLTVSNPDDVAAKANTFSGKTVTISGNTSAMHGGGIGCNGTLSFGEESFSYSSSKINIVATKVVNDDLAAADAKNAGGFTFQLLKDNVVIATATSDANGKIEFKDLSTTTLFGAGTTSGNVSVTLTLKEVAGDKTGMAYDTVERTITINATRKDKPVEVSTGKDGIDITTHILTDTLTSATVKVGDQTVEASVNGNTVTLSGAANFTNTMAYGELSITKVLEKGDETDTATGWNFTVNFTGNELRGSYSYTVTVPVEPQEEGDAEYETVGTGTLSDEDGWTITLKAGQTATITGIPVGAGYTVTEAEGNYYETGAVNASGTIGATASKATFTNTIVRGSISISKALSLDGVAENLSGKEYTFAVYSGETLVKTVTVTAGGEAAVIDNLRVGTYTIVEVDPTEIDYYEWNNVTMSVGNKAIEAKTVTIGDKTYTGFEVEVAKGTTEIVVNAVNSYDRHLGNLTVKKTVTGNNVEMDREWHFTVTLESPASYVNLSNEYSFTVNGDEVKAPAFEKNVDGTVTIEIVLKHGQSVTIKDIPVGTKYTVEEEAKAAEDGYTVISTGNNTAIVESGNTVEFTNSRYLPTTDLTVNKVWYGDDEADRPASILVQLYRNGVANGSPVTLSAENNWTYTWYGLVTSYGVTWTAAEIDVPEGYVSSTSIDGTVVTITNSWEEEPEEPEEPEPYEEIDEPDVPLSGWPNEPDEPDEEIDEPDVPLADVPQTSDSMTLWLPLAVLSGTGLAVLTIRSRKNEEGEEA